MQITIAAFLVSSVLGCLSGLGVGGGSLLMLWLTLVINMPIENARMINLMFFIPSAAISVLFHIKEDEFSIRPLLPAIVCGIFSSLLFVWISSQVSTDFLQKAFGILLLPTGLHELLYRERKAR